MPYPELYGLAKGLEATQPFIQYAFMEKEKEKARRRQFVSDYYMDLLRRGEITREEAPIVGPMAGPVPTTGPLAGYLRPPAPTPRLPVPEETFDIMEALSRGERLPPGYRVTPTEIPKELKPYEFRAPTGVVYRAPTAVKQKTDPRFSELMSLAGKHWFAYKTALDMDDEEGIALYSKRFDSMVEQAENVWRKSNPDIPLPRFELEDLAKDPTAWQKFWGTEPKRKVVERKVYAVGQQVTTEKGTFKYLGNNRWQKIR